MPSCAEPSIATCRVRVAPFAALVALALSPLGCAKHEEHASEREGATMRAVTSTPDPWVAAMTLAETRARAALPEGPGRAVVGAKCVPCHSVAIVTQQHKSREGWTKTITQMKAFGATLSSEDETILLDYVANGFGPTATP